VVLSAAEIKAVASGNPAVVRKVQIEAELSKLAALRAAWADQQIGRRQRLALLPTLQAEATERQILLAAAQERAGTTAGTSFGATVRASAIDTTQTRHTTRAAAGKALRQIVGQLSVLATHTGREQHIVGTYRGCVIRVRAVRAATVVELCLDHDGNTVPIADITIDTDMGVFSSIDAQLRELPTRQQGVAARRAQLAAEATTLQQLLAQPWSAQAAYDTLGAELDTLDAALTASTTSSADAAPGADAPALLDLLAADDTSVPPAVVIPAVADPARHAAIAAQLASATMAVLTINAEEADGGATAGIVPDADIEEAVQAVPAMVPGVPDPVVPAAAAVTPTHAPPVFGAPGPKHRRRATPPQTPSALVGAPGLHNTLARAPVLHPAAEQLTLF
jgi:hypothetical protein